jgi:PAS domain S-box-containing protein
MSEKNREDAWGAPGHGIICLSIPEYGNGYGGGISAVSLHAFVTVDQNGIIESWNAGAQELFGHAPEEAIGKTLDLIVPADYRDRHWTGFRSALGAVDAQTETDRGAVILPIQRGDGSTRAAAVRLLVIRDALDGAAGAVAVFNLESPDGDKWSQLPVL